MLFFRSCRIHLGHWWDPAVAMCAVCLLAAQTSAVWQGNHISTDGLGWGKCPAGVLREAEMVPGAFRSLSRGSPPQHHELSLWFVRRSCVSLSRTGWRALPLCWPVQERGEKKPPAAPEGKRISGALVPLGSFLSLCWWDCPINSHSELQDQNTKGQENRPNLY